VITSSQGPGRGQGHGMDMVSHSHEFCWSQQFIRSARYFQDGGWLHPRLQQVKGLTTTTTTTTTTSGHCDSNDHPPDSERASGHCDSNDHPPDIFRKLMKGV